MTETLNDLDQPADLMAALLAREQACSGIAYDPRDPALHRDPYPLLHRLRAQDPVHFSQLLNAWLLTRHADAQALLRMPLLSKDPRKAQPGPLGGLGFMVPAPGKPTMIRLDPPDHTRLRGLVNKAFTPRAVADMAARIDQIVEGLLDGLPASAPFDLMERFAIPLPVRVIAAMLGVDGGDLSLFKQWANDYALGHDVSSDSQMHARRDTAKLGLVGYFRQRIAERRGGDGTDLLSALVRAEEQGDQLSEEELLGTCLLLLVAGIETTSNLLGNGVLALLQHPRQAALARESLRLTPNAVEELLRYDSPVQAVQRILTSDTEVGGRLLPAGSMVITLVGAVNRDPAAFDQPDTLDLQRPDVRQFAFGDGIHYCLGAPLARSIASVAIPALLRRYPDLQLTQESTSWRTSAVFRGLTDLSLAAGPASSAISSWNPS